MYTKVLLLTAIVAYISAEEHHHASSYASIKTYHMPHEHHHEHHEKHEHEHHEHHEEPHHHPKYKFKYGVEDHHTGDIKSHSEERDGHEVKGEYSLHQPDGKTRQVHYFADKHGGFQAFVSYSDH